MPGRGGWVCWAVDGAAALTREEQDAFAARSHQRARRSGEATKWLELAAQHTRTFYGLIARQALGKGGENDLRAPVLTRRHVRTLAEIPAGRRAIARAGAPS